METQTWDLEEEVVAYRVAGPSFLNNDVCQKVIVVNGNGSMVIDYQCWSCVWDLLHSMNLVAWNSLTEQTIKKPAAVHWTGIHLKTFDVS